MTELVLPEELLSFDIAQMRKAGVNLGHRRSKRHPAMTPFISGILNNTELIDLEKAIPFFQAALKFLAKIVSEKGLVLFVGTRPQARTLIQEIAERYQFPYVNERWIGGLLTNFETISRRLAFLEDLEKKKASGEFEKYQKQERLRLEKNLAKLQAMFGGLRLLSRLPDVLVLVTPGMDSTAIREAKRKKIPMVAIVDSDQDPNLFDYPILGNDDASSSLRWILGKIEAVISYAKEHQNP